MLFPLNVARSRRDKTGVEGRDRAWTVKEIKRENKKMRGERDLRGRERIKEGSSERKVTTERSAK